MMNMELEDLVQQIALKVVTELGAQEQLTSTLVFAKKGKELPGALKEVASQRGRLLYYDEPYTIENVDRFILPCLYIDQMVDLAMGKGGSRLMYGVRQVLLAGKKVEVAEFEYRQFLKTAPAALTSLYDQYYDTLKKFGLVELTDVGNKEFNTKCLKSGVVTEEDVLRVHNDSGPYLEVAESCCITPLAIDCAREHSIVIKRVTGDHR